MRNSINTWRAAALAAVLSASAWALISCSVGPDYSRPAMDVPAGYKTPATQPAAVSRIGRDWWTLFGDAKLTELEEAALASSQDLKAAIAQVDEARQAALAVRSQFLPTIGASPSVTRSRPPIAVRGPGGPTPNVTSYQIPLDLSYEVDIWGKVRRSYESAKATFQASVDDAEVVRQTLLADVATDYFTLRSLDAQDHILNDNVKLYADQVELFKKQKRAGMAGDIDVAQAVAQLDATRALELDTRRQRADTEHAIAILIGVPPAQFSVPVKPLDFTPPAIPTGLPSDLLRRRPDVAQAEADLAGASAQIGVATANFYPTVTLNGSAGFQSIDLQNIVDWQHRVFSWGPAVSAPIFTGGLLEANLAQAKSHYDELAATYRGTLLGAFRDVEDALNDIRLQADEAAATERAVTASQNYYRLSRVQFDTGQITYLQVIDAERTMLTNELSAAQILNARWTATVLLIKALGGGWQGPATADPTKATLSSAPAATQAEE